MSERVATDEAVKQACQKILELGETPTVDRVLQITGGSKTTVAPLVKEALRTLPPANAPPAPELDQAIEKAAKAIASIRDIYSADAKRQSHTLYCHYSAQIAERDARIAELEAALDEKSRAVDEAWRQISRLKDHFSAAERGPASERGRTNAMEEPDFSGAATN